MAYKKSKQLKRKSKKFNFGVKKQKSKSKKFNGFRVARGGIRL
jgi:hypothetical protein